MMTMTTLKSQLRRWSLGDDACKIAVCRILHIEESNLSLISPRELHSPSSTDRAQRSRHKSAVNPRLTSSGERRRDFPSGTAPGNRDYPEFWSPG